MSLVLKESLMTFIERLLPSRHCARGLTGMIPFSSQRPVCTLQTRKPRLTGVFDPSPVH